MASHYSVACSCGYNKAKAKYYEKDSPYSSHAIWSFTNLDCDKKQVEEAGYMSIEDALKEAQPRCPDCGADIKKENLLP